MSPRLHGTLPPASWLFKDKLDSLLGIALKPGLAISGLPSEDREAAMRLLSRGCVLTCRDIRQVSVAARRCLIVHDAVGSTLGKNSFVDEADGCGTA